MYPDSLPVTRKILLPRTGSRLDRKWAHLKLLSAVRTEAFGAVDFSGRLLAAGDSIPAGELPRVAVVLECVGPIGGKGKGHREILWVLWRFDWGRDTWLELARAQAVGGEWAPVLREAAAAALYAKPELYDVATRARSIAAGIMTAIEDLLAGESAPVRQQCLSAVYDQVAALIVSNVG